MTTFSRCVALSVFLLGASRLHGQTWTINVGAGATANNITSANMTARENTVIGEQAIIEVVCENAADCAALKLQVEERQGTSWSFVENLVAGAASTANKKVFTLKREQASPSNRRLALAKDSIVLKAYLIAAEDKSKELAPDTSKTSSTTKPIDEWLTTLCPGTYEAKSYNAAENEGEVILTPTGNILASDLDQFDENDRLRVRIVGDTRLLPLLKVRRKSAFRDKSIVRIVGGETPVPSELIRHRIEKPKCGVVEFILQDFEPGKGEVEILVIGDPDRAVGHFEFNVNPLYSGILSLGAVRTNAVDPDLKLVASGAGNGEMIIVEGNTGLNDLLYALFYTPYVWGKRDLEKSRTGLEFLNPTFGIVLNDISNNALVGLSLELPNGFLITVGAHLRKIKVLAKDAKVKIGQPFVPDENQTADKLPTSNKLKTDWFFAASVDLRAAAKLFGSAAGAIAGK